MRKYFVSLIIIIITIVSIVPVFAAVEPIVEPVITPVVETINDGRINQDNNASYVVFADGENGLVLLNPTGGFLFAINAEEIALTSTTPSEMTLLGEGSGVSVYRMPDGSFHVVGASLNGEKSYVVHFINPVANTPYTSYEE